MGIEGRPQQYFIDFDRSQGGNTLGGDDLPQNSGLPSEEQDELTEQKGLREAIAVIGQRLTERIDGIDHAKLTEDEFAKGRYYRYSIAVSLRGMSREEFLPTNSTHREDELAYLHTGAVLAAANYLEDFPNNPIGWRVLTQGMGAPDLVHRRLYMQGIGRNILQFIRNYNP